MSFTFHLDHFLDQAGLCCENPAEHEHGRTRTQQNTGFHRTREPEHARTLGVLLRSAFICVLPEHSCVLLRSVPSCVLLRSVICVPAQNTDPAFYVQAACVLLRSGILRSAGFWGLGWKLCFSARPQPKPVGCGVGFGTPLP